MNSSTFTRVYAIPFWFLFSVPQPLDEREVEACRKRCALTWEAKKDPKLVDAPPPQQQDCKPDLCGCPKLDQLTDEQKTKAKRLKAADALLGYGGTPVGGLGRIDSPPSTNKD